MPLYEYQCGTCGRRIEKIQSFSAEPLTVCESCGGPLERLISAPAIQFKGSGWYVTDYAKGSSSAASGGDRKSGGEGRKDGGGEGKGGGGGEGKGGSGEAAPASAAEKPAAATPKEK